MLYLYVLFHFICIRNSILTYEPPTTNRELKLREVKTLTYPHIKVWDRVYRSLKSTHNTDQRGKGVEGRVLNSAPGPRSPIYKFWKIRNKFKILTLQITSHLP